MPILDQLERRALFRLTRSLAFIVVFVLTLGLIIGAVIFADDFLPRENPNISYKTVWMQLHPQATPTPDSSNTTPSVSDTGPTSVDLPVHLQPYFNSPDSKRALYEHLSRLDVDERNSYIANLVEVMNEAKVRNELNDDVINTYYDLKDSQLEIAKEAHTLRTTTQLYILGGAVSTLFLIALCSLILVLLAIERNTRRSGPSNASQ
jgi:hypothetical protein